ncbi:MAG: hypothetical protein ACRCZF_00750, partial [Gemmataceae bacterium]
MFGSGFDDPLAALDADPAIRKSENGRLYRKDLQGSVREVLEYNGDVIGRRAYDAFGNTILDNSGRDFDRYGYTGADYDAFTGLTTHGVRV